MNIKHNSNPSIYIGPRLLYGNAPKSGSINPFWYNQKKNDPTRLKALMSVFQQPAKAIQSRVNRQRRPFDAFRGY